MRVDEPFDDGFLAVVAECNQFLWKPSMSGCWTVWVVTGFSGSNYRSNMGTVIDEADCLISVEDIDVVHENYAQLFGQTRVGNLYKCRVH